MYIRTPDRANSTSQGENEREWLDQIFQVLFLQVRPFSVERSRVFLVVLRVLSLVYNAFRIPIETEDVVKSILMLPGHRFCRAFIFDAFSLITDEVYL